MSEELEAIKKELGNGEIKVEDVNILFLDISSSCTGYAVARINFVNKTANFSSVGCLWLDPEWSHQEKYSYMYDAISGYFWIVEQVDHILVESYSVNPKRMSGVNVVSEMQGSIKAAAWSNGVKVNSIAPQSWRSQLGLKKTKDAKGNTDWKTPTRDYVNKLVKIPDEVLSNITGNLRQTPSDIFDAIGVGLGWLKKFGITKVAFKDIEVNKHVGHINE